MKMAVFKQFDMKIFWFYSPFYIPLWLLHVISLMETDKRRTSVRTVARKPVKAKFSRTVSIEIQFIECQ